MELAVIYLAQKIVYHAIELVFAIITNIDNILEILTKIYVIIAQEIKPVMMREYAVMPIHLA